MHIKMYRKRGPKCMALYADFAGQYLPPIPTTSHKTPRFRIAPAYFYTSTGSVLRLTRSSRGKRARTVGEFPQENANIERLVAYCRTYPPLTHDSYTYDTGDGWGG